MKGPKKSPSRRREMATRMKIVELQVKSVRPYMTADSDDSTRNHVVVTLRQASRSLGEAADLIEAIAQHQAKQRKMSAGAKKEAEETTGARKLQPV